MIPPLLMDLKPHMTVLDLCAAPGSKSAQLIEMIHAGEEDRSREVATNTGKGLDRPEGDDFADDGRSTGLLVANDVDYRRAHMLVHQIKRLSSPNIIVTNHDATIFPSIRVSPLASTDGRPVQNKYLKFDRILADVPCSGDGTVRKNMEIWQNWTPSNGLGLHNTQVRILIRALQMLKVGGRVVYSTCSMNPVEDEAVLAEAISRCGGPDLVEMLETKDYLPGLKRYPGFKKWSVMDKVGRVWNDWDEVSKFKETSGDDALLRLSESMFPPKTDLPLDRAMRIYPHLQDTGAFFIAILEKRSEIKARPEERPTAAQRPVKGEVSDSNGTSADLETAPGVKVENTENAESTELGANKRKRDDDGSTSAPLKRVKSEEGLESGAKAVAEGGQSAPDVKTENGQPQPPNGHTLASESSRPAPVQPPKRRNRDQPFEEPFKYLSPSIPELGEITEFYGLSSRFPRDRFMVRNPDGVATKNMYYTSALAKEILQENEGKGLKFVHAGLKMFVKQDAPSPEVCPWRIQTDGLRLLESWIGDERIVKLHKKETLRKLLIEMFPRFHGEEYKNLGEVGEQVVKLKMGCCVLVVEPSDDEGGLPERMVFPLWKSVQSLNLMLPKEERRAMLLRIFNDDTPLVNLSKGWAGNKGGASAGEATASKPVEDAKIETSDKKVRNSSSPEPEAEAELETGGAEGGDTRMSDEEDGGVQLT